MAFNLDTNLPLMAQAPKIADPMAAYAGAMQLRQQQEAGAALTEQRQALAEQRRLQAEAAQREAAQAEALRNLKDYSFESIASVIGPESAAKVAKGIEDFRGAQLKTADEARRSMLTRLSAIKALPSDELRADWYNATVKDYADRGLVDPSKVEPYSMQVLDSFERELMTAEQRATADKPNVQNVGGALVNVGKDGKTATEIYRAPEKASEAGTFAAHLDSVAQSKGLKSGRQLDPRTVLRERQNWERAGQAPAQPRDERLVQIMGPQGTPVWVKESQAVGQPAAQAARAVTGAERQALAFFNRAKDASESIAGIEGTIANQGVVAGKFRELAPNFMQSEENQRYEQAQRAFTEARLRKESGAAIPVHEYENDRRTYFAVPGDTPQTIAQKQQARAKVLEGIGYAAGKAYDEFYGEPLPRSGQPARQDGGQRQQQGGGNKPADPLGIR